MLPSDGDILVSGGDSRPWGQYNAGIRDASLFNADNDTVSAATSMNSERWYPTSTTLPNGDILLSAGRDSQKIPTTIPEVYSTANKTWRSLNNASMAA